MALLGGDDAGDVAEVAARRLFAKDVQAAFQAADGGIRRYGVGERNKKHVEAVIEKLGIVVGVSNAVLEAAVAGEADVAHRHRLERRVRVDDGAAALADDAVTGDAHFERAAHDAASAGAGAR